MIAVESGTGQPRGGVRPCPLCGYRFDKGADHCGGCPLHSSCGVTACPKCGYEFIERSATVEALRRLGRRIQIFLTAREGEGSR